MWIQGGAAPVDGCRAERGSRAERCWEDTAGGWDPGQSVAGET